MNAPTKIETVQHSSTKYISNSYARRGKDLIIIVCLLGCPTFWQLLRKNKLESNSDRIFVADFKNDVIFQLRRHLEVPPSGFYANFDLSRKRQELER